MLCICPYIRYIDHYMQRTCYHTQCFVLLLRELVIIWGAFTGDGDDVMSLGGLL